MTANTKMMTVKEQNKALSQTSVMVSADLVNKIHNENCLETMAKMPDNFIDLTVTSPPYDGLRTYNGYSFDFENVAKELFRATKQGGVVVWVVGDATMNGSESGTSFKQALFFKEIGFNLHDTMIYQKVNYVPLTHNRYEQSFEFMFIFSKGKPKTFNPIMIPCKQAGKVEKYGLDKRKAFAAANAAAGRTAVDEVEEDFYDESADGEEKAG